VQLEEPNSPQLQSTNSTHLPSLLDRLNIEWRLELRNREGPKIGGKERVRQKGMKALLPRDACLLADAARPAVVGCVGDIAASRSCKFLQEASCRQGRESWTELVASVLAGWLTGGKCGVQMRGGMDGTTACLSQVSLGRFPSAIGSSGRAPVFGSLGALVEGGTDDRQSLVGSYLIEGAASLPVAATRRQRSPQIK
jgi:hypothetical protein